MQTPAFWQGDGLLAHLLGPFGRFYGACTAWRLAKRPSWRAPVPVVCVGNLVAGGAGKTPVAIAIAQKLRSLGLQPVFLSRGYGGKKHRPLQVVLERDRAEHVGDEGLLLAAQAPTVVADRRVEGARLAVSLGAQVIVMDDGHQDSSLYKDITLVVVDRAYGFGNNRLLPAGPLRESVGRGLARASAIVLIGESGEDYISEKLFPSQRPVLQAYFVPGPESAFLAGQRVVAFAGIGRPEKFFSTLRAIGACPIACYSFADHRPYTGREIQLILDKSLELQAIPITTSKDAVRLSPEQRQKIVVLTVTLAWHDGDEKSLETVLLHR